VYSVLRLVLPLSGCVSRLVYICVLCVVAVAVYMCVCLYVFVRVSVCVCLLKAAFKKVAVFRANASHAIRKGHEHVDPMSI
jgi:hypothetical protein